MNLKEQLQFYLHLRNLTAAELARRSGVSAQTISYWISGGRPKDIAKLKSVADQLTTTLDNLLYGNGLPNEGQTTELQKILKDGGRLRGLFEIDIRMLKSHDSSED